MLIPNLFLVWMRPIPRLLLLWLIVGWDIAHASYFPYSRRFDLYEPRRERYYYESYYGRDPGKVLIENWQKRQHIERNCYIA